MKIHFNMLKDELTGNPRWGQNVIDKFKLKIFVPVLAFKKRLRIVLFCYISGKLIFILHLC